MFIIYISLIICFSFAFPLSEVIVISYSRPHSLQRCLESLSRVDYLEKEIGLTIYIDGPTSKLTIQNLKVASKFNWPFGKKRIIQRLRNFGVFAQWFKSVENSLFALIIEDDITVSPSIFRALNVVYSKIDQSIFYGITLQRAQWQLGLTEKGTFRRLDLIDPMHFPVLVGYPAIGTWGQVIFPKHFQEFKKWYSTASRIQKIDGLIHEKWRLERKGDIWSYWFTRYALEKNLFNFYFNLPNGEALATSHRETGKHSDKTKGPQDKLLEDFDEKLFEQAKITLYDECFEEVSGQLTYNYWNGERDQCRLHRLDPICKAIRCFYKPGRYPHHHLQ
jgi:hypothetical protein